jgi:hypothetical protein
LGYSLGEVLAPKDDATPENILFGQTIGLLQSQIARLETCKAALDAALSFLRGKLDWIKAGKPDDAPRLDGYQRLAAPISAKPYSVRSPVRIQACAALCRYRAKLPQPRSRRHLVIEECAGCLRACTPPLGVEGHFFERQQAYDEVGSAQCAIAWMVHPFRYRSADRVFR